MTWTCEARADGYDLLGGGFDLPEVHPLLGLTVLTRLAHWTEKALLTLLVLVPVTGIGLVATGDDAISGRAASRAGPSRWSRRPR